VSFFGDRVAPAVYDFFGQRIEREVGPLRDAVLAAARGRVLEIGAGTGFNLSHYPSEIEELVVTEPGAGMLERAKRRAGELDLPIALSPN